MTDPMDALASALKGRLAKEEERLDRDFDTAREKVNALVRELAAANMDPAVVLAAMTTGIVPIASLLKGGMRGPARDMIGSMVDASFNDFDRMTAAAGLDKLMSDMHSALERGDRVAATKVLERAKAMGRDINGGTT